MHREYTRIVLIDAVDGKPPVGQFADTSEVKYRIAPRFANRSRSRLQTDLSSHTGPAAARHDQSNPDSKTRRCWHRVESYVRNVQYSATEARKRYLWLELTANLMTTTTSVCTRGLQLLRTS